MADKLNIIRKFIDKTRHPLDYINNIIGIVGVAYTLVLSIAVFFNKPLSNDLKIFLFSLSSTVKFTILFLLLFLAIYLLVKTYKILKYTVETQIYHSRINSSSTSTETAMLTVNYMKVFPPTSTIREIHKEFEKRANKWASDAELSQFNLTTHAGYKRKDSEIQSVFVSKKRRMSISFETSGLKVPREQTIHLNQLKHTDIAVKVKPFFENKKWRQFIRECLERIESNIAGKELTIFIFTGAGIVWLQIHPDVVPKRIYSFFLRGNKIYEDLSGKRLITTL